MSAENDYSVRRPGGGGGMWGVAGASDRNANNRRRNANRKLRRKIG